MQDITYVPAAPQAGIVTESVLPLTTAWATYVFQVGTCQYQEQPEQRGGVTFWRGSLRGTIPGYGHPGRGEMERMRDGQYILRIELSNGTELLAGTLEAPFEYRADTTTGRRRTDTPGIGIEFFGELRHPAPIYSYADPCPQIGMADFALSPWLTDASADPSEFLGVYVEREPAGPIAAISSWPDGHLIAPNGTVADAVQYIPALGYYAPVGGPNYLTTGTWTIRIPSLPLLLGTGESCIVNWEQSQVFTAQSDHNNDHDSDHA